MKKRSCMCYVSACSPNFANLTQKRTATTLRKKVLIISGPTGAGKSDLSLNLAKLLDGEIISADSVQVFKGLDIGSNKISQQERAQVPHHLIDTLDIHENFTAGDFHRLARVATEDILNRGKVPIVTGGTGFYIRWFMNGEGAAPRSTPETKSRVATALKADGSWEKSIAKLRSIDPTTAEAIPQNDFYRLGRALEIYELSGKPPSFFRMQSVPLEDLDYDFRCVYIDRPDFISFKREIDERCEIMVEKGLLQEVMCLMKKGLNPNTTAGRAIGYRQALAYLQNKDRGTDQMFVHMLEDFMANSRQYCRRQRTWFKREPSFLWLPTGTTHSQKLLASILEHFEKDFSTYQANYATIQDSQKFFRDELGEDFQLRSRQYTPVLRRFDDFAYRRSFISNILSCWSEHFGNVNK